MSKAKKAKKFAAHKRMINPNDTRLQQNKDKAQAKETKIQYDKDHQVTKDIKLKELEMNPVHLYFSYNTSLGPPYHVILDTILSIFLFKIKWTFLKTY